MTQGGQKRDRGMQGVYGSGGSYGSGGGFDEDAQREEDSEAMESGASSVAEGERDDAATSRRARSAAQQDDEHNVGFEREVDANDAPPTVPDSTRSSEDEKLAAKKRRGSRI